MPLEETSSGIPPTDHSASGWRASFGKMYNHLGIRTGLATFFSTLVFALAHWDRGVSPSVTELLLFSTCCAVVFYNMWRLIPKQHWYTIEIAGLWMVGGFSRWWTSESTTAWRLIFTGIGVFWMLLISWGTDIVSKRISANKRRLKIPEQTSCDN